MDGFEQLDLAIPALGKLVEGVRRDQLDDPTPCARWKVRDLLAHLVEGGHMFAEAFRGAPVRDISRPDPGVIGDDPAKAFAGSFADFTAAIRAPGAMDRTLTLPFGEVPAPVFLRLAAFDLTVHAWDVATATGQRFDPPDDLVAEADEFARQALGPETRDGDTFAVAVEPPPGANRLERLVAFSGRQP
ncbi:MAG: TIGR03086 family metal-binding protein [Acidimicrobiia bacterium]|nr:TIGR03086 family metal-binding protein [Acidimicrobiia bacterium]